MWKNQLKVGSKSYLDTNMKPIPQPKKRDCIEWVKKLYDILSEFPNLDMGHPYAKVAGPSENKWTDIPEELACMIKDFYINTPDAYDVDTNMISFSKRAREMGYVVEINNYATDLFDCDFYVFRYEDKQLLIHAGFSWGWKQLFGLRNHSQNAAGVLI